MNGKILMPPVSDNSATYLNNTMCIKISTQGEGERGGEEVTQILKLTAKALMELADEVRHPALQIIDNALVN
jgi:hypothetical protein